MHRALYSGNATAPLAGPLANRGGRESSTRVLPSAPACGLSVTGCWRGSAPGHHRASCSTAVPQGRIGLLQPAPMLHPLVKLDDVLP